ncbi:MAG: hypothetical protein Q4E67_06570 [Planctomycetia bacterium]|nr:hypothetical protein [Planctomycetia bacterium]
MKTIFSSLCFVGLLSGMVFSQEIEYMNPEVDSVVAEREEETSAPLETIHDYWNLYEISSSVRESYQDGVAWQPTENLLLFQFRIREMPLTLLEKWSQPLEALSRWETYTQEECNAHRFEAFRIDGTLKDVQKFSYPPEVTQRYRVSEYYLCQIALVDGREIQLFCNRIPEVLQKETLPQSSIRVGAYALMLKKGEMAEGKPIFYLLTNRLSWYPDTPLGKLGMDYGLFDDLDSQELSANATRSRSRDLRLSLRNRECFYQMLYTVGRIPPEEWKAILRESLATTPPERREKDSSHHSVVPLFVKPIQERGNFFWLRGVARQIVPVQVEDEDIVERLGITRYYEIFLYPQDSQDNPVTVLVRRLPKNIVPGDAPGYRVELTVPAFFFNTWGYRSMDEEGKPIVRLTPLLIGGPPKLVPPPKPNTMLWFQLLAGVIFALLLILATGSYFQFTRKDKEFWEKNIAKNLSLPEGAEMDSIDLQKAAETLPQETDFRNWK